MFKVVSITLLGSLITQSSAFAAEDYPEAEALPKMRKIFSESNSEVDNVEDSVGDEGPKQSQVKHGKKRERDDEQERFDDLKRQNAEPTEPGRGAQLVRIASPVGPGPKPQVLGFNCDNVKDFWVKGYPKLEKVLGEFDTAHLYNVSLWLNRAGIMSRADFEHCAVSIFRDLKEYPLERLEEVTNWMKHSGAWDTIFKCSAAEVVKVVHHLRGVSNERRKQFQNWFKEKGIWGQWRESEPLFVALKSLDHLYSNDNDLTVRFDFIENSGLLKLWERDDIYYLFGTLPLYFERSWESDSPMDKDKLQEAWQVIKESLGWRRICLAEAKERSFMGSITLNELFESPAIDVCKISRKCQAIWISFFMHLHADGNEEIIFSDWLVTSGTLKRMTDGRKYTDILSILRTGMYDEDILYKSYFLEALGWLSSSKAMDKCEDIVDIITLSIPFEDRDAEDIAKIWSISIAPLFGVIEGMGLGRARDMMDAALGREN